MSSIYNCMSDGLVALKKGPLDLDFSSLITDDEPPQVVVVRRRILNSPATMDDDYDNDYSLRSKTDKELGDTIMRMKGNLANLQKNLKDGGERFRKLLHRYEAELQRREKAASDDIEKLLDSLEETKGVCKDVLHRTSSAPSLDKYSIDTDSPDGEMDSTTENAFGKELSTLNRCSSMPPDKEINSSDKKTKWGSVNEVSQRSPKAQPLSIDDEPRSSGFQKNRKRTRPPHLSGRGSFSTRKAPILTRSASRFKRTKEETVVLLDVDDSEPEETTQEAYGEEKALNRDSIIYYPSRNATGSIEIRYSSRDCLAPHTYVSSTIMNFYIRYLQEKSPPSKTIGEGVDYHLFNTFFYEKLKDAVAKKNVDENSFTKLRRWWKNVNIFQKAYIFLPIHENIHWSLLIVCMPDKEDHSGLKLLHLDSLGIHSSKPIFNNIRSFLKEEWRLVKEGEDSYHVPIADSVWESLPRRIEEQTIEVPQQRNDYDCGIFVLYFMERFISDAPKRLKKKHLSKFGKNWFNPKEASGLRKKIRRLLDDIFEEAEAASKQEPVLEEQEDSEPFLKTPVKVVIE